MWERRSPFEISMVAAFPTVPTQINPWSNTSVKPGRVVVVSYTVLNCDHCLTEILWNTTILISV